MTKWVIFLLRGFLCLRASGLSLLDLCWLNSRTVWLRLSIPANGCVETNSSRIFERLLPGNQLRGAFRAMRRSFVSIPNVIMRLKEAMRRTLLSRLYICVAAWKPISQSENPLLKSSAASILRDSPRLRTRGLKVTANGKKRWMETKWKLNRIIWQFPPTPTHRIPLESIEFEFKSGPKLATVLRKKLDARAQYSIYLNQSNQLTALSNTFSLLPENFMMKLTDESVRTWSVSSIETELPVEV